MKKTAVVAFLAVQMAWGQAAPVRVFSSNGVRTAIEALKAQCERAVGRPLAIEYGSSAALKRKIDAGEAFDIAILTPEVIAVLVKAGKIADGTAVELARVGVGFGIREGAPKPDIATPEAVKQTLLKAKSISIAKEGASRGTIDAMYARLGIAQAVASKTRLEAGTEQAGASVAEGRSELDILPLSEIPLVKGVRVAGPLPGDLQNYLIFQASVGAHATEPGPAKKAIQFLTSPAAAAMFKAKGMETK
jgi:molybdate transport system substrate-binding protein